MPFTKQTIAIFGADGNPGAAIAKKISGENFRLLLLSKNISKAQSLAKIITQSNSSADVCVMECKYDACWEADIIILAISDFDQKEIAELIKDVATQKIVIRIAGPGDKSNDDRKLQKMLPHSKIIQACNIDSGQSVTKNGPPVVLITGHDEGALGAASDLFKIAGFNPQTHSITL